MPVEPPVDRPVRRDPGRGCGLPCDRGPRAQHAGFVSCRKQIGGQHASEQVERRGERRKAEAQVAPSRVMKEELRRCLDVQQVRAADRFQIGARAGVSGDQQVLPVVDDVAGRPVSKRVRPAARIRALLQEKDGDGTGSQCNAGGEAAQPCADDDDGFHTDGML